jgi:hypothetical protein
MRLPLVVAVLLLVGVASVSSAQTPAQSFEELQHRLSVGRKVVVQAISADGKKKKASGTVTHLSPGVLTIKGFRHSTEFAETDVLQVSEKYVSAGSVGLGAVVGAMAGIAIAQMAVRSVGSGTGQSFREAGVAMAVGGAFGAGIGSTPRLRVVYRKTTSSRSISAVPLLGAGRKGVAVTIRY